MGSELVFRLLKSIKDNPKDMTLRLVLGDVLEEQGDRRASLIRLIPNLLATPLREYLHPSLSKEIRTYNGTFPVYQCGREKWPAIPKILTPPVPGQSRTCYVGFNSLGRLLSLAIIWDTMLPHYERFIPYFTKIELWGCRLLTQREHNKWVCDYPNFSLKKLGRRGFTCFHNIVELSIVAGNVVLFNGSEGYRKSVGQGYTAKHALAYTRCLDILDHFQEIAPWEDMLFISKQYKSIQKQERQSIRQKR